MLEHAEHRDPQAEYRRLPQGGNNQRFVVKPSTEAQRIPDQNQFGEHQCLNERERVGPVADVVIRQGDSPIPRKYRKKPEQIRDDDPIFDEFGDHFLLPAGFCVGGVTHDSPLPLITSGVLYWPKDARAVRSGALDICMNPWKGRSSSRIRKIAPETESAQTNRVATTVVLRGAKRPKLMKMTATQKTRIARNGRGIELPLCAKSSERVRPRSTAILSASARSAP